MSVYSESINELESSVKSILRQTYSNIEFIIIVDNPQNKDAIKYLRSKQNFDRRLKLFINPKNKGLVYSLNRGINLCSGEYIARMDADDIAVNDRIEKELNYLKKENLSLVSSNYFIFNQNKGLINRTNFPQSKYKIKKLLEKKNCLGHPTWLVKKNVFKKLDGYRDIDSCEDYDFLIRLSLSGFSFDNLKEPLLKYRFNVNSISRKKEFKQKIISKILAYNYKKKSITDVVWLNMYLQSDDFNIDLRYQQRLESLKQSFYDCSGIKKINYIFLIMWLKLKIRKRFNNLFEVNYVNKEDL